MVQPPWCVETGYTSEESTIATNASQAHHQCDKLEQQQNGQGTRMTRTYNQHNSIQNLSKNNSSTSQSNINSKNNNHKASSGDESSSGVDRFDDTSEVITLVELLDHEAKSRNDHKPCYRSPGTTTATTTAATALKRKRVRFATNNDNQVWCMVQKAPDDLKWDHCRDALWWTDYELRLMFEHLIMATFCGEDVSLHLRELRSSYKASRKPLNHVVVVNNHDHSQTTPAKPPPPEETLELCYFVAQQVLEESALQSQQFSKVHVFRERHAKAVFKIHHKITLAKQNFWSEEGVQLLQRHVGKYAQASQVIAHQVASADDGAGADD